MVNVEVELCNMLGEHFHHNPVCIASYCLPYILEEMQNVSRLESR